MQFDTLEEAAGIFIKNFSPFDRRPLFDPLLVEEFMTHVV